MLPGKTYTPEDILLILRRRFWLLMVPFAVIAAAAAVYARKVPDVWRSEAVILVIPQSVPDSYVRSTVTTRIEDRLQTIKQQIMSRTRLEQIIQEYKLYPERVKALPMEDVVEGMRRDVVVQVVRGDAFTVSYVGDNPRTVQKVADKLTSLFMEESVQDRDKIATSTSAFLESQVEDARRKLLEQEKKVEEFRRQYSGQLPTQMTSNQQAITNTEMQVQSVVEALNRDRDKRLDLDRKIRDLESADDDPGSASPATIESGGGTAAQQLARAQEALTSLLLTRRDDNIDVRKLKRVIAELKSRADAEAANGPVSDGGGRPSAAARARAKKIEDAQNELAQLDRQITVKQAEEKRLRGMSAGYQARIEATPTRESELIELSRDYEITKKSYESLLGKLNESKLSANLEKRQIGERFKTLDPARVPERPSNAESRNLIKLFGLAGGLTVGLALLALVEYRDSSFMTDHEVKRILSLPVLAVVPLMQSDAERRRALKVRALAGVGLGTTVVVCLAVVAYTFVR